ncbi:hypothetical protein B0H14DRAFT_3593332 [Mycena olivaceomarginata]|nr:hypothetical protein B0H14DRAFT_3593332 [Mycena olivaceomarginata]
MPSRLCHLLSVLIFRLLKSYLSMEPEDVHIQNLILPFANDQHEGPREIGHQLWDDLGIYPKEKPPNDSLLWHLISTINIFVSNATQWKKQSRLINGAIDLQMPAEQFVALEEKVLTLLLSSAAEGPHIVRWDEFAQCFAVDMLGSTVSEHNFEALKAQSVFVHKYNSIMCRIADPIYLIVPFLKKIIPMKMLLRRINNLMEQFLALLKAKEEAPEDDMMLYMLRNPNMSQRKLHNNMILLFISSHDTSTSALSTLFYFLAKNSTIQHHASADNLSAALHLQKMNFMNVDDYKTLAKRDEVNARSARDRDQGVGPNDPNHRNLDFRVHPLPSRILSLAISFTFMPFSQCHEDLSIEILAHLPLRTIAKILLVQKAWKTFIETHQETIYHNAAIFGCLGPSHGTSLTEESSALGLSAFEITGWKEFCAIAFGMLA